MSRITSLLKRVPLPLIALVFVLTVAGTRALAQDAAAPTTAPRHRPRCRGRRYVPGPRRRRRRRRQVRRQLRRHRLDADRSALVLMMTGPGLALFYGGMVRRKNVLATMMQSFILMAVVTRRLGARRLQPGVRRRQLGFIGEPPLRVPQRRRRGAERAITPPRSRTRPSWSTSSCSPSSRRP